MSLVSVVSRPTLSTKPDRIGDCRKRIRLKRGNPAPKSAAFIFALALLLMGANLLLAQDNEPQTAAPPTTKISLGVAFGGSITTNKGIYKYDSGVISGSLRWRLGNRSWLEFLVDYYPAPDLRYANSNASSYRLNWGYSLWRNKSLDVYAKAGLGYAFHNRYYKNYHTYEGNINFWDNEEQMIADLGAGLEIQYKHGFGLRLEALYTMGGLSTTMCFDHLMPNWLILTAGIFKRF